MLRDSVCDERANIEECLYDGGDCCLEFKVKKFCKNCSCILTVDREKLTEDFANLNIKPLQSSAEINEHVGNWTVKVEDVISQQVCAVLCLNHNKKVEINTWYFDEMERVCRCGWFASAQCPENKVALNWTLDNVANLSNTFIQLGKTISCSMANMHAFITIFLLLYIPNLSRLLSEKL